MLVYIFGQHNNWYRPQVTEVKWEWKTLISPPFSRCLPVYRSWSERCRPSHQYLWSWRRTWLRSSAPPGGNKKTATSFDIIYQLYVRCRARVLRVLGNRLIKWTHHFPAALCTFTRCLLATTWALVTMSPSSDTTNPEPLATATSRLENIILSRERKRREHVPDLLYNLKHQSKDTNPTQ